MAVTIEDSSPVGPTVYSSGGNPIVLSVPVSDATKLIAALSIRELTESKRDVSSATRDGQSLTETFGDLSESARNVARTLYLDSPNTGTADLSVTMAGNCLFSALGALLVSGVAEGGHTVSDYLNTGTTNPEMTLTCPGPGLIICALSSDIAGGAVVRGTGQTILFNVGQTRTRSASYTVVEEAGDVMVGYTIAAGFMAMHAVFFPAADTGVPIMIHNGTSWVSTTPRTYNGSSWVPLAAFG